MAAPVGHIISALALLNVSTISDHNAFLVGTSFPDIRYITSVKRSVTHKLTFDGLKDVVAADTSFEAGRRFHVFLDREREKHMREHDAYRFVKSGPLRTQMLKLVEDHILFNKLSGQFDPSQVFTKIYKEERAYGINDSDIKNWHDLLSIYTSQTHWFNFSRYFKSLMAFQSAYGLPEVSFNNLWQSIKTLGFFIAAYFQVERLSRNQELRGIILDFYESKLPALIKTELLKLRNKTVENSVESTITGFS